MLVKFLRIGFLAGCLLAPVAAWPAGATPRTWDTVKVRQMILRMNGGTDAGFASWRRQDRDGQERWTSSGTGNEQWEVRPTIVLYGVRIGHGNRARANRFTLMMSLLTAKIMEMEKYSNEDTGSILAGLAQAAAAHPGQDVSVNEGPYVLTLTKIQPVNAWVYSIEPR